MTFWYYFLRGWSGTKVWLHSYGFKGANLNNGTFDILLELAVKNPLLVSIPIHKISGTIYLNNSKIATIDTTYNKKVLARKINIIPIPLVCNMGAVGDVAKIAIHNNNLDGQELMVILDVEIGTDDSNVTIPVNTTVIIGQEG